MLGWVVGWCICVCKYGLENDVNTVEWRGKFNMHSASMKPSFSLKILFY